MKKARTENHEKKIHLRKEAIRKLQSSQLEQVAGGFLDYPTHNCTG